MMGDKIVVRHISRPSPIGRETRCLAIVGWAEDITSYGLVIEYRHYEGKRSGIQPLALHPLSGDQNLWFKEVRPFIMTAPRYWQDPKQIICALPERTIGEGHPRAYPHLVAFQAAVAITKRLRPDDQAISLGIVADRLEGVVNGVKRAQGLLTDGKP